MLVIVSVCSFITLSLCAPIDMRVFSLDQVSLDPPPKPEFLVNATQEVIDKFMDIYLLPSVGKVRKVADLDSLVGSLRAEVQEAYNNYKSEAILVSLGRDERMQEVAEKAHYTMAHLHAMKISTTIGRNERKKRTEMMFAEFSDFLVKSVTDEVGNAVDLIMKQMLRALLFTEKMIQ